MGDEARHIELIRTDRHTNEAYIAVHSKWPSDDPDECGNWVLRLDLFEQLVGQKFDDGEHDFAKFDVPRDLLYAIYRQGHQ